MTTTPQDKSKAYATHQRQDEDGRETDKRALLRCAGQLQEALNDGGKDMKAYADALRSNQRLWTIFQVSLCDPENTLPRDLKVTLLNLSRYVDRTSFRAISEFMPQLLNSLIDINRTIAAGLKPVPQAAGVAPGVNAGVNPSAYPTSAQAMTPPPQMPVAGSVSTSA